jgi:hypothetical protein
VWFIGWTPGAGHHGSRKLQLTKANVPGTLTILEIVDVENPMSAMSE